MKDVALSTSHRPPRRPPLEISPEETVALIALAVHAYRRDTNRTG